MPSIITYGCSAHYLNLLGLNITPDSIMKHAVSVQKYHPKPSKSKNHHRLEAWLKEYSKAVKPHISCNTWRNSQVDCLESFVKNRPYYVQILEEHEDDIYDTGIVQVINNQMIYKEVKPLLLQIKHIAIALDLVQKENCSITDVCDIWINLTKEENFMGAYKKEVTYRFKQSVTDYHLLAYMLHLKYFGLKLSCTEEESARNLLANINPNFVTLYHSFAKQIGPIS